MFSQLGTGNCGLDVADSAMQHVRDPLLCGFVGGGSGSLQGSICSRGLIPAPISSPSKHIITQLDSNSGGWRIQVPAACSEGRRKRVDFAAYEAWLLCKTVS